MNGTLGNTNLTNDTNGAMDEEALVRMLNDDKARLMVPATVYIIILMVSGLIGNLMVVYYYAFKSKFRTTSFFIVSLALYDLIVCTICMPTEIADIELFYTFENAAACKILRFLNYLAAVGSILTLIAIAVDRFRKIYKHTGRQMTIKDAKVTGLVVFAMAVFLSWPSIFIYGSIRVRIPNDLGLDLKGSDCTSTKDRAYRGYVWAMNLVHFGLFFICSAVLIVLYSIIGHSLYKHAKNLRRYGSSTGQVSNSSSKNTSSSGLTSPTSMTTSNDETASASNGDLPLKTVEKREDNGVHTNKETKAKEPVRPQAKEDRKSKTGLENETVRITMVMIAVTVLFIASFLPYLSLTVWRIFEGKHEAEFLSGAKLVAFKIGSRSFLLNSSLNPWIYGIFNSSFRNFYFNKLKCR